MVYKLLKIRKVLVESWEHVLVKVLTLGSHLDFWQVTKVVVCFSDKLFRIQKCVNKEATTADLTRYPITADTVMFSCRHCRSSKSADSGPVRDSQYWNSGKQNLDCWAAKVMGHYKIRVNLVKTMYECFKHLLFVLENLQSLVILYFLSVVKR